MEQVSGWAEQGGSVVTIPGTQGSGVQRFQQSFRSATVTVRDSSNNLATIYSDDLASPTAKANPFTASSTTGSWSFFVVTGTYSVTFSGGSITAPFSITVNVGLGNAGGVPSYAFASLPTSKSQNAGDLARVTNTLGGIWMDSGSRWIKVAPRVNIMDAPFNCSPSASAATNTAGIHAAMAAVSALGGGIVEVPMYNFPVSEITFGTNSNVILEGVSAGISYVDIKTASNFIVTSGVWGIRFPPTSSYCGMRRINLSSNGALNDAAPNVVVTAGVEYGVIIETAATLMDECTVFGFQFGCSVIRGGNSNVFEKCAFLWNTKCGFAGLYGGSAAAYACYHPNLTAPATFESTTTYTVRNCTIRSNGWGIILRDGYPNFYDCIIESNYFGGLYEYIGTLDLAQTVSPQWYNVYFENNWSRYDVNAAYTINQNNYLQQTLGVWIPWNITANTATTDAGYQVTMSDVTPGVTEGPSYQNFYKLNLICVAASGSSPTTSQKGMFMKQAFFNKFYNCNCLGGDQPNAVRLDYAGGFLADVPHFWDWNGTLPASGGNRMAQFTTERSAVDGGMTATVGHFRNVSGELLTPIVNGLIDASAANAGQIKFPATQNASANANTLDDYEEGTWTASLTCGGGAATLSPSTGSYTKIGRLVTLTGKFTVSATTGTGVLTIGGLPFQCGGGAANDSSVTFFINDWSAAGGATTTVQAFISGGTSSAVVFRLTAGSLVATPADTLIVGSEITVSIHYMSS